MTGDEVVAIRIIAENGLASVAPGGDVVDGSRDSTLSGLAMREYYYRGQTVYKIQDPTPVMHDCQPVRLEIDNRRGVR